MIKHEAIRHTQCVINQEGETSERHLCFGFPDMLLLEEELSVQIAHVDRVQVNLHQNRGINTSIPTLGHVISILTSQTHVLFLHRFVPLLSHFFSLLFLW